jgi:hypothetical protein
MGGEDAYRRGLEILLPNAPTTGEDELVPRLRTVIKHEAFALRRQRDRRLEAALVRVLGLKGRDGRALVDIERAADAHPRRARRL